MKLELETVFDEYPNPIYIVRPILENGQPEDFTYIYVNEAYARLVGKSCKELIDHRYSECFGEKEGERFWLDLFAESAIHGHHDYVNAVSLVLRKKMYTEVSHIDPDLCCCMVHDFQNLPVVREKSELEELRRKAHHDHLTGFYNRYYLKEMEESNQFRENVGIVYLDINNLKHVNDSQGHIAGDKLILRSSEAIRFYFEDHWVFRVGGDEFVILTQGLSREEFFDLADRSKRTFERENLASLGYDYYETVDDLQRCVDECDAKMYAHKKQKKARLVQLTPKEPRLVTVAEESCPAL